MWAECLGLENEGLGSPIHRFWRRADRFEPAADVDLRVRFAAEMTGAGTFRGSQIPAKHRELVFTALDHKPVNGMVADDPTYLALKLFKRRHGFRFERYREKLV